MDVDLECTEIMFAQKLASGEPTTRARALKALHDWIRQQSQKKPFVDADMMRLCKGLHYVLWMQDKMLLQEELADKISNLLTIFTHEEERVAFIRCMFASLSKEWHAIDRWRMDKFLMLMRRVVRVLFAYLKDRKWKKEIRASYWDAFKQTTISADKSFSEGLKFHFAAIFLDELDNAGGLTEKQVIICLRPFAELLSVRGISKYLFDSILDEIFNSILHQRSEEIAAQEEGMEVEQREGGLKFDYKALKKILFDIGKRPETTGERRRKLYEVVQRFEVAAAGGDPYHFEAPEPEDKLTLRDISEAEARILKQQEQIIKERRKYREDKKASKIAKREAMRPQPQAEPDQDSDADDEENEEESATTKKKTKLVPKKKKSKLAKVFGKGRISKKKPVSKKTKKASK